MVLLCISEHESNNSFPLIDVSTNSQLDFLVQTWRVRRYSHLAGLVLKDAVSRIVIGLDNRKLSLALKILEERLHGPMAVKTRLEGTFLEALITVRWICGL